MVVLQKGDHVWIELKPSGKNVLSVPIGAVIKDILKDQVTVIDDDGNEFILKPGTKMRNMHISSLTGVDDMISLGDLNEAGILRNLLIRYRRNEIYTYTGKILVAVNPYSVLPIYTVKEIKTYQNKKIGELSPHIFAIADNAYNNMRRVGKDQSIIISGESGAGKTESTKLILQFLAAVSGQHSWIEQQVLDSNPILEAFGNAKTIRNDNSSRFGKYIDIYFGSSGAIEGAKIDQFLLEKSRIVSQMKDERNYHVFYCILDGLPTDARREFGLQKSDFYNYLNQGGRIDLAGCNDIVDYPTLRSAMKVLTFSDSECHDIFRLLAAFLHLGNLCYKPKLEKNIDCCDVVRDSEFNLAAQLLQVDPNNLSKALTTKNIVTKDDFVVTTVSASQAINIRDALVKGIYGRMFVWIVEKINKAIYKPTLAQAPKKLSSNAHKPSNYSSIGVLDIFGFENFDNNSYEQLCINYANENLQQFFVRHIFKMEQEEYAAEMIDWQHISFTDNQDTLDFIGIKNCNILSLIDEESRFPKGTDDTLLTKLINTYSKHPKFIKQKADIIKIFGIQHFAGTVHYKIDGFLEKNRDSFNVDLVELIQTTKSIFLKNLFGKEFSMGFETRKRAPTLGVQFKKSLESLMKILQEREPFFIRCIKPNELKRKLDFDRELCLRQLRYSGMMETIRIRKAGYPIRHGFSDFIDRYRILVSGVPISGKCKDSKETVKMICKKILDPTGYQIGKTKLFLKDAQDYLLEDMRDKMLSNKAIIIQKTWRKYFFRSQFLKKKASAVKIEAFVRMIMCRRKFRKMKKGFSLLQAGFRAKIASRKLQDLKGFVRNVQKYCRGYLVRERLKKRKASAVKIQTAVRRYIAMKNYKKLQVEDKKRKEALQLRLKEEQLLKNKMPADKAMIEAEKRHKMRLNKLHDESMADAEHEKQISSDKRQQIADAEKRRNEPVDESQMLDEIFGSFDSQSTAAGSIINGPKAFQDLESSRIRALNSIGSSFHSMMPDYLVNILDEDVSEFTFTKFAATYFQHDMDPEFTKQTLKKPLLFHSNVNDQMSALSVWIAILRFMKDLPEPMINNSRGSQDNFTPIMTKIYQSLGRQVNREDLMRVASDTDRMGSTPYENSSLSSSRKNIVSLTLKKTSKFTEEVVNHLKNTENASGYGNVKSLLEERPTTNLEKLHFIIGYGILVPQLRDEIYCQICKQLTNNPSKESISRGLILLTLCIGCFAPTEKFVRTLRNFIQTNFQEYSNFIVSRLQRTFSNGTRNQPPSLLELKAIKHKEPIILAVACMNSKTETVLADSASTAQELCSVLSQKIGLRDQFGFSLFIAILDKVSSIGSCGDHVMDAISQCEQFAKEKGLSEAKAQWRLFFRKEIFTPWHNPSNDSVATNLIYHQVVRGIRFGEYRCDSDEDISKLCAYQLYIDNSKEFHEETLTKYLPAAVIGATKEKKKDLFNLVNKAYDNFVQPRKNQPNLSEKLKEEIVDFARIKWSMLFSRFYEAVKFSGPSLETNEIIFTVNWTGVYLVDSHERIHLELSFPEIVSVSSSRTTNFMTGKTSRLHGQSLSLSTIKGGNYTFNCANSEDIRDLIIMFLEGLKERSQYAVAVQSFSKLDSSFISCEKGDLLIIENQDSQSKSSSVGWFYGENFRTKEKGDFPADVVYILPILTFPNPNILALFSDKNFRDSPDARSRTSSKGSQHTLEEFSKTYFRTPANVNRSFSMGAGNSKSEILWEHNRQVLKLPLLKKLLNREDLCQQAITCFTSILLYMKDQPSKTFNTTEIVEAIFEPCLKHEILKDEVYCQLIKQITSNPNQQSEQSGWELLWLATGIMAASSNLHREVLEVFRTSKTPLASECQMRLQKTLKLGQRRFPPHSIEINSIQMSKSIHHKIYFPNESIQAFEITSNTKCKELCQNICNKIGLRDSKGFALFVKSIDKAISMPEGDFFFDFIRQLSDWVKKHRPAKDGQLDFTYQVFFMKKLWTNTVPGFDRIADVLFHYPQEVRKYLYGYHKVTAKDMIVLGALILRTHSGNDKSKIRSTLESLDSIIPKDIFNKYSGNEIQQKIISQYNVNEGMNEDDAKVEFLKIIYYWPTFGSAFFEVKQSTNLSIPEKILIAINKNGVYLIHTKTKETLEWYPYSSISNWSSGNTYFNMTIGNLIHGKKLLCETPLGYKMDDLLTSYISLMLTTITKNPNN